MKKSTTYSALEKSIMADLFYAHNGLEIKRNCGTIICCCGDEFTSAEVNFHSTTMMDHMVHIGFAEIKGRFFKATPLLKKTYPTLK